MIRVFGVDLELSQNRARLVSLMADQLRGRYSGLITDNVLRTLAGQMLTTYVVAMVSACRIEQVVYGSNQYGKPELIFPKGWHFNRSHSGDLLVCVVGREMVGIDIEQARELPQRTINAIFTNREVSQVSDCFRDLAEGFCDRWTLKECYLKALGIGVPDSPFSVEIINSGGRWYAGGKDAVTRMHFKQYDPREGYRLSVCSLDHIFANQIEWVAFADLLTTLE